MKWLCAVILLLGCSLYASGIVTIEGHAYGKTETVIMLESKGQVFSIKKSALGPSQRKALEELKWGATTSVTIPLTAVASVRDLPAKTK